ncbi:hypothetical protein PHYSODRAFT_487693, partial [Phytophthora sojae]
EETIRNNAMGETDDRIAPPSTTFSQALFRQWYRLRWKMAFTDDIIIPEFESNSSWR